MLITIEEAIKNQAKQFLHLSEQIKDQEAQVRLQNRILQDLISERYKLETELKGRVGNNIPEKYVLLDDKLVVIKHNVGVSVEKLIK